MGQSQAAIGTVVGAAAICGVFDVVLELFRGRGALFALLAAERPGRYSRVV